MKVLILFLFVSIGCSNLNITKNTILTNTQKRTTSSVGDEVTLSNNDARNVIELINRNPTVPVTFLPTVFTYNFQNQDSSSQVFTDIKKNMLPICEHVINSQTCEDISPENLLNCSAIEERRVLKSFLSIYNGCQKGFSKSIDEMFTFVWQVLVGFYNLNQDFKKLNFFSLRPHHIDTLFQKIKSSSTNVVNTHSIISNHINSEFNNALLEVEHKNFRKIRAFKLMSIKVIQILNGAIGKVMVNELPKYGCLNLKTKNIISCQILTDLFFPPSGLVAFLKNGKISAKARDVIQKSKDFHWNNSHGADLLKKAFTTSKEKIKIDFYQRARVPSNLTRDEIDLNSSLTKTVNNITEYFEGSHYKITIDELNEINLIIPDVYSENKEKYLRDVKNMLSNVPNSMVKDVETIVFNPFQPKGLVQGNSNAPRKRIDIYPYSKKRLVHVFRHELAHILSLEYTSELQNVLRNTHRINDPTIPSQKYIDAAKIDGNSVSAYGDLSINEDYAEFAATFLDYLDNKKQYKIIENLHKNRSDVFIREAANLSIEELNNMMLKIKEELYNQGINIQIRYKTLLTGQLIADARRLEKSILYINNKTGEVYYNTEEVENDLFLEPPLKVK